MSARALLVELRQRGLCIKPDGLNLEVRGPKPAVTADILKVIREQKAELLTLLAAEEQANTLLRELRSAGHCFAILHASGQDVLAWFAPDSEPNPELRQSVARLSPELMGMLRSGCRQAVRDAGA